jgi:hypothetical protein
MLRNGTLSISFILLLAPLAPASAFTPHEALRKAEARRGQQLNLARKQMALFLRTRDPLHRVQAQDRVLEAQRAEVQILVLEAQRCRAAGETKQASALVQPAKAVRRSLSVLEGRRAVTEMDLFRYAEARAAGRPLSAADFRAARALHRFGRAMARPMARTAKGPELPAGTTELDMIEAFDRGRK